jgi:hypothetical protein
MISADIIACSHQPVKNDSVFIHYQINQGAYATALMSNTGSNHYQGVIPKQPGGSIIRYYLSAADQSGRHSTTPLIGSADPFQFESITTLLTTLPDTLWYNTYPEAWYGKYFRIQNDLATNVTLTALQMGGMEVPWWIDSISVPALPHLLAPGDTISVLVKVPIGVNNSPTINYYLDSLRITSTAGIQHVALMINADILNEAPSHDATAGLRSSYPNPFSGETAIPFILRSGDQVTLEIFDMRGRKIRTLLNDMKSAGLHKIIWNGNDDQGNRLPGGIYLYRLTTGNKISTKRMVLIR